VPFLKIRRESASLRLSEPHSGTSIAAPSSSGIPKEPFPYPFPAGLEHISTLNFELLMPLEWEQKNHMLCFIRRLPGKELIVAVFLRARDRLEADSLITIPDLFRKGRLHLPPDAPSLGWRHLFTNKKIPPLKSGDSPALSLGKAMGRSLFTALVRMDPDHES